MSTALIQFTNKEIELLRKTIAPGTTDDQLALFVQVCGQLGLNPFARQIYAVVRNEKQRDGSYEKKMTIQTSIDGYRLLAQRSGEYAGQDGPYWYDSETKTWDDVWIKNTPPAAAKVGVMRQGFTKPIYAVARFDSYAVRGFNQATKKMDGELTSMWGKMPEVMIAKVAEALALRRAFPAELSGIYTKEEMEQADVPTTPTVPVRPMPTTVMDASESQQDEASEPVAIRQENKPPTIKERFGAVYKRALALKQFNVSEGASDEEKIRAFLDFAGPIVNATLTSAGHLTMTRLNEIDAYLNAKDAA